MHIFICRNCGKLTESENKDEKVCSSCGAPLDPVAPGSSGPIRLPSTQPSTSQARQAQPPTSPTRPPQPRTTGTTPPTPSRPGATQAPARSTQPRPVELPSNATPPPSGRPPPRPTPPPTAREQLRAVELETKAPETSSENKPPSVAGEEPTDGTITPSQSPVDAGTEGMEVYENKDLVACPQCGYGCDPNWGKCPLCDAPISGTGDLKKISEMDFTADEASFSKGLVPCPKCQYACDPSWGTCPICNSELKKPETPAASDKPDKPDKPDTPEKPE